MPDEKAIAIFTFRYFCDSSFYKYELILALQEESGHERVNTILMLVADQYVI